MDWTQFTIFCFGLFGMFFWNRADIRRLDTKLVSINELLLGISIESKDFHARIFKIEERNRK